MDSPVKQRLKAFIKHEGLSIRQFCLKIGASPAFVANIVKSIQHDRVNSISNQFPDLNIGWLLTGEGEMLKADAMTSTYWRCTTRAEHTPPGSSRNCSERKRSESPHCKRKFGNYAKSWKVCNAVEYPTQPIDNDKTNKRNPGLTDRDFF